MRVHKTKRFTAELKEIVGFIAEDSVFYAKKFRRELLAELDKLGETEMRYRKSIYVDAPNVYDFICKGHVIPYRINESKNRVEILGIFKHNIWHY